VKPTRATGIRLLWVASLWASVLIRDQDAYRSTYPSFQFIPQRLAQTTLQVTERWRLRLGAWADLARACGEDQWRQVVESLLAALKHPKMFQPRHKCNEDGLPLTQSLMRAAECIIGS
jgi:hypothetical protein